MAQIEPSPIAAPPVMGTPTRPNLLTLLEASESTPPAFTTPVVAPRIVRFGNSQAEDVSSEISPADSFEGGSPVNPRAGVRSLLPYLGTSPVVNAATWVERESSPDTADLWVPTLNQRRFALTPMNEPVPCSDGSDGDDGDDDLDRHESSDESSDGTSGPDGYND